MRRRNNQAMLVGQQNQAGLPGGVGPGNAGSGIFGQTGRMGGGNMGMVGKSNANAGPRPGGYGNSYGSQPPTTQGCYQGLRMERMQQ